MQLHQVKSHNGRKKAKRIGRGGKKGTYCGRGLKGQKSRAGSSVRPGFAGGDTPILKRMPKQRGAGGKSSWRKGVKLYRLRRKPVAVNLNLIDNNFKKGEIVSPQSLLKKGLISARGTGIPRVKILGKGNLTKELKFVNVIFSKSVGDKIKREVKKSKAK